MPQPHGLGRGLASLIPQKKNLNTDVSSPSVAGSDGLERSGGDGQAFPKVAMASPFLANQGTKITPASHGKKEEKKEVTTIVEGEVSEKKISALDNLVASKRGMSLKDFQEKSSTNVSIDPTPLPFLF